MRYRWCQIASWSVLSVVLGLALLVGVTLKGYAVATEELLEYGLLSSRWFLMLVVEWEIFFAIWLLGGFYRLYPRTTCWVALLYFFALFDVAVDNILKGRPSCPCFGKMIVPPWIPVAFDLVALVLLVVVPVPQVSRQPLQWLRWFVLAAVFSVFGVVSFITMKDYSTMTPAPIPLLRKDSRLLCEVSVELVWPRTQQFLEIGRKAAGIELTVDEKLQRRQPNYGEWAMRKVPLWAVMEMVVRRQRIPARWEKVDDGYAMVPAARFGKSLSFWLAGATLLLLSMMGLRRLDFAKEQKPPLHDDADTERTSVGELPAAKATNKWKSYPLAP